MLQRNPLQVFKVRINHFQKTQKKYFGILLEFHIQRFNNDKKKAVLCYWKENVKFKCLTVDKKKAVV